MPALGGQAREMIPIGENEQDLHEPRFLSGGRGILFVSHPKGESAGVLHVYREGRRRELLRLPRQRIGAPAYDPSGHIVFGRAGNDITAGLWAAPFSLDRLEIRGEPFLVAPDAGNASVSGTGTLVFVRGAARTERLRFVWVDRTGKVVEPIGEAHRSPHSPWLSPDGRRLAFVADDDEERTDLWVRDLERGTETRLTSDESAERGAFWTASGAEIVYTRWDSAAGVTVHVVASDGSGAPRAVGAGFSTDIAPDGKHVVVYGNPEGDPSQPGTSPDTHIWLSPLDGSTDRRMLVRGPGRNDSAHVSPDGRYLVFRSDRSGASEVYLTRFPEGRGLWPVSVGGGRNPRWDPRGGRLYFRGKTSIFEVTVGGGDEPRLGKPSTLFEVPEVFRGMAVAPAGDRFVLVEADRDDEDKRASGRSGIKVVQSWTREFRR